MEYNFLVQFDLARLSVLAVVAIVWTALHSLPADSMAGRNEVVLTVTKVSIAAVVAVLLLGLAL